MLNLVDELLSRSRRFQQLGRFDEALNLLTRLVGFHELPVYAAEEIEIRLGELSLRRRNYKRARRHLLAALVHQPDNARAHYLLANAFSRGRRPDAQRALAHYRRSIELEPDHAIRLCAYGLLLVRLGQAQNGLRHLRRAVEGAPEDVSILKQVIKGMQLANHAEEARRLLVTARFRSPRDRRLLALWNDLHFHQLRRDQQTTLHRSPSITSDDPVLLPFLRLEGGPVLSRRASVRRDGPSGTPPPRGLLHIRRPDQRHAQ
jgi:tetratricopeptide (TPR) repeat protein